MTTKKNKITQNEAEVLKRQLLFRICKTKEELKNWITLFLGVELPDCTVDPSSNSNPMDLVWEIYEKAINGQDPEFTQVLAYSARSAFKTLACSIMCVLSLLHWRRSMCTMAAIEQQSRVNIGYVTNYFNKSILNDFLLSNSRREIEIGWYENENGEILSFKEYKDIPNKNEYKEKKYNVRLLVATAKSANSSHCSYVQIDECDLAPSGPLEEAKLIPDRGERGELPITFYTSSRKYAYGNVQKIIDNTHEQGTHIRHWNIIDVTQGCPKNRYLPQYDKIPIYVNEKTLKAISEKDHNLLPPEKQDEFIMEEGYVGCLKKCKLYPMCRGRLATEQKSTSKLLKTIDSVQATFRQSSVEITKAQMLCWKPSLEGMIYPRLDRNLHLLTTNQIIEKITGEKYQNELTKEQLIQLMNQNEVQYYAGIDHGFAHCFAGTLGAKYGKYMFILDCFEIPELELSQKIEILNYRFKKFNPIIYPDTSDPSSNKTMKRAGFRIKEWKKGAGSVIGGIEVLRMKLNPTIGEPELYFLKDDPGVELLFKRLSEYHWKTDSLGNATNVPTEENDDAADSIRYLVMNVFDKHGRVVAPAMSTNMNEQGNSYFGGSEKYYSPDNWINEVLSDNGINEQIDSQDDQDPNNPNKNKGIIFDI